MNITILKTNRTLYRVDDAVAIALVESGLATEYVPKPKPEPAPEWKLFSNEFGEIVGMVIKLGAETIPVSGNPKTIVERCARALAGRRAPLPSAELVTAYARAVGAANINPDYVNEQRERARAEFEQKMKDQAQLGIPEQARRNEAPNPVPWKNA